MSRRVALLIAGGLLAVALATLLATHEAGTEDHPMVLEDTYDRMAYQQRGRWLASEGTPYLDEFSEYPQLSTWLMALPYLFFDHGVEVGQPFGAVHAAREVLRAGDVPEEEVLRIAPMPPSKPPPQGEIAASLARFPALDYPAVRHTLQEVADATVRRQDELVRNREAYGNRHHILMALWFLILLALVTRNLLTLGERPAWALLLLLPASLYFGFNRFDLVMASAVALAIGLQLRERPRLAAFVLGLAIMIKWAPIVLLPLFLSKNVQALRARGPSPWTAALLRGAVIPGAIAGAVIVTLLGVTFLWSGGGMEAVTFVFDWHSNVRLPNHSSFLSLLTSPDRWSWFDPESRPGLEKLFKVLQLAPGFLLALLPLRTSRALLLACLTATLFSITFSEFFSPQWVLWITALGLYLAPRSRVLLVLVIALELVMYAQLPWFWYAAQASGEAGAFWTVTNVRMTLLLVFLGVALVMFLREARKPLDAADYSPA